MSIALLYKVIQKFKGLTACGKISSQNPQEMRQDKILLTGSLILIVFRPRPPPIEKVAVACSGGVGPPRPINVGEGPEGMFISQPWVDRGTEVSRPLPLVAKLVEDTNKSE